MRKLFEALDRKLVEQKTDAKRLDEHRKLVEKMLRMHENIKKQREKLLKLTETWRCLEPDSEFIMKLHEHFNVSITEKIRKSLVDKVNYNQGEYYKEETTAKEMEREFEKFLMENIPKLLKPKKEN